MFGLTRNQMIAITIAVLSVLSGATAQLTDLFGAYAAKTIVSAASLITTALSSIMAVLTSQGSTVKEVQSMPGIEQITVNKAANNVLASLAVDQSNVKIAPAPGAEVTVAQTASAK